MVLSQSNPATIGGAIARLAGVPREAAFRLQWHSVAAFVRAWDEARAFAVYEDGGWEIFDRTGDFVAGCYLMEFGGYLPDRDEEARRVWASGTHPRTCGTLARYCGVSLTAGGRINSTGVRQAWIEAWRGCGGQALSFDVDGTPIFGGAWKWPLLHVQPDMTPGTPCQQNPK
jgi:hypothetical protein